MAEQTREHLSSLLSHFDTVMMVTRTASSELRSRPMIIADKSSDSELWFATPLDSAKVGEIECEPSVNLALQKNDACISISGTAEIVRDRSLVEGFWKETWKPWFPKGKTNPNLGLVRVRVQSAEYWDLEGMKGLRFLFQAAAAYVGGTTPEEVAGMHAKVPDLSREAIAPSRG